MKRLLAVMLMVLTLGVAGCGSNNYGLDNYSPDSYGPSTIASNILSDPTYDGYISRDASGALTVFQGETQRVFAGIDPSNGTEYRGFLDFYLGGARGIPWDATIFSAYLDVYINSIVQPVSASIPIRIDLVYFQPPALDAGNFDVDALPALASQSVYISPSDAGGHVTFDVTDLMVQAQYLGLPDFQLRIMKDLSATSPGLVEIDDATSDTAPLLQISYF